MIWFGMVERVGSTLAEGRTLRTNVRTVTLLEAWPSLAATPMVTVPVWLLAGRKVSRPVVLPLV